MFDFAQGVSWRNENNVWRQMNTLYSIIIPVYNVAPELRRAVESVQKQSFSDWEIVLVDDGSKDGSSLLCDHLSAIDSRIKSIHQMNSGVVAARQHGFEASSGEWVLFLDGDDALKPDCLHKIEKVIKIDKCDIVQFGYDTEFADGNRSQYSPEITGVRSTDWVINHSPNTPLDILGMCIWNKCYRRRVVSEAFADVGEVRISHSEDGLFAVAAFLHSDKIMFLSDRLYRYIMREDSAVHKVNVKIVDEKEKFIRTMESLARKSGRMSEENIRRMIEFHAYQACCYIFLMLKRNKAKWHDVNQVLMQLNASAFFKINNPQFSSFRRRAMKFLLKYPIVYWGVTRLVSV